LARDAVLCPEHAQTLEHQLKNIVAREALARVLDRYHDDFPDEYHFVRGATTPALLQEIFHALFAGSEPDERQAEKGSGQAAPARKAQGPTSPLRASLSA
jgi:hypothetical protein